MISKNEFEQMLLNPNVVDTFKGLSKEELTNMFGNQVATMVNFNQNNSHHCYDLFTHCLKTVEHISSENLTEEQLTLLKVSAFFHDVAKPMVAKFNEKTNQQVFYGHATKSAEVATPILEKMGYSQSEVEQLQFLIAHHDDFISYKAKLEPYMFNHLFLREINTNTVAEKILENKYDFSKMGYSEEQIKGILFYLVNNKKPFFKTKDHSYTFDVDINTVKKQIASGNYNSSYAPTLADYKLLINLCKADASAQAELVTQNGKIIDSRKDKVFRLGKVENALEDSFTMVENLTNGLSYGHNFNS